MAYIQQTQPHQASGLIKTIYDNAIARAGKVWNIVKLTGINPRMTRAHLGLYQSIMHKDSALTPRMREALAVIVSSANECHY
jgi:alkylhydroperoxidase family enzyme